MSRYPFVVTLILIFTLFAGVVPGFSSSPLEKLDSRGLLSKIAENQGKVIIVNFWATWCRICKEEIEILKDLQDVYSDEHVRFLSVSIDDDPERIADYIQRLDFNFQTFAATEGLMSDFGIQWVPKTYIFNRNGKIVYKDFGLVPQKRLEDIIDNILERL